MNTLYNTILDNLLAACQEYYANRLVSLVIFGSVGRGTPRADSDIDCLLVVENLPHGRMARVNEFSVIEKMLAPHLEQAWRAGVTTDLSPVFKTPAEVERGSLLFLDMIDDARFLYDRNGFMQHALEKFKARLEQLGARRIWQGNTWYWDLKPDYKPGEVFEL